MNNRINEKLLLTLICILTNACNTNEDLSILQRDDLSNSPTKEQIEDKVYYWHQGKKVYLSPIIGKKYVVYDKSNESLFREKSLKLQIVAEDLFEITGISFHANKMEDDDKVQWAIINGFDDEIVKLPVYYNGRFFMTEDGVEVGLSHLAYIKLKNETDIDLLESYSKEYGFRVVGTNKLMPLWVTIDCTDCIAGKDALSIADGLYETGNFQSAQPDLIVGSFIFGIQDDPLFSYQWNLCNTGQYDISYIGLDINYISSSDMCLGSPDVSVAVIDQGMASNHPDLNLSNYSYDTINGSSPGVIHGNHGTACAGIIAAKTNNIGVSGISPESKVMSISHTLSPRPNISQELANGFNSAWRNGASVISNSWGGLPQSEILEDAIQNALDFGRNGKGCVVVFASGNDNYSSVSYPASAIDDIIAVGAMSPDGKRKDPYTIDGEFNWGSNYGQDLDIVAPGVKIPTTDRTGSAGYNPSGDYYLTFGGTSSACPHVAAVAALVISVAPFLTQQQVAEAILASAYKLPDYNFLTTKTYGTWNQEVGYGLLNAKDAIQKAVGNQTIYYYDKTISEGWISLVGSSIYAGNVIVQSGSKLSMTGSSVCQLSGPFVVESGSSLVINN